MVSVEVLPSNYDNLDKLRIGNFTITEFTELEMRIQVNFETPIFVSMSAIEPDYLRVTLL